MIMVYVTPELAALLQEPSGYQKLSAMGAYKELGAWLQMKEAKLEPVDQGSIGGPLQNYFQLHTNKKITEEDLADLLKLPGIDGAYDKPDDSPPR